MSDYDVCVIGGGPAGYAAAMRCYDFGKRVCLVEKSQHLGGAGIHNGALSSKTLWELSCDYQRACSRDRGYYAEHVALNYPQVVKCVQMAVDEKAHQMRLQLDRLRETPSGKGSIEFMVGKARFLDPHRVVVEADEPGQTREVAAKDFVLATGSRPRTLPDLEVDGKRILTSDHIMGLERFPRSMVILGAGVVGCEFATIFANYGQTKVYLIDRAPRILPFEDEDVARVCAVNLENKGVTVHRRCKLISMEVKGDEVEYVVEQHTGGREAIRVEVALISIGRVPNTHDLSLDKAGVHLTPSGHVEDEDTRTNVPHIYAVGDITDDIALVNVGEIEGRHAAERICGQEQSALSYANLSTIMFLDPEVAAIGMNELQAQDKRIPYRVAVYGYNLVNRAIAMRATDGFVKLLTTDDDEMRVLGMRALGAHASTMIETVSLMIKQSGSVRELAELLHPHPAVTEALQDCVRMLLGSSIYKPEVFTSDLRLSRIDYEDDFKAQE